MQDGDRFWRMPECYIRGSTIKYLRIPDEIIDMVKEEVMPKSKGRGEMRGRGGSGAARGRGGPGRGGEMVDIIVLYDDVVTKLSNKANSGSYIIASSVLFYCIQHTLYYYFCCC